MELKLENPVSATNADVEPYDVRQVKSVLNHLGYYKPFEKTGMNGFTDTMLFEAIRKFQKDNGLDVTGAIKPNDATEKALEQQQPSGKYIWCTVRDGKVRSGHAERDGQVFDYAAPPKGGHPGMDYNCRCWAEPVAEDNYIDDLPLNKVYPEVVLIPVLKARTVVNLLAMPVAKIMNSFIGANVKMNDTRTWPKPPVSGRLREGSPSRAKPRSRGEKSFYDERCGEWRYAKEDKYHNAHWDYKSSSKAEWRNVSIDAKSTVKLGE